MSAHEPAFDVLSYGTIGMDNILRVPHFPSPNLSTHTQDEGWYLGGKATNTAAFLSTWGLSVAVSGTVIGKDAVGDRLFEALAQFPGISTRYLEQRPRAQSMYCCILVTPDGERAIIGVRADHVSQTEPTAAMINDARMLTLDLYGGKERVRAARLAHEAGRMVVIGDLRDADHAILAYSDVAIASAAELRAENPEISPLDFARVVQASGPSAVIITDGAGAVAVFDGQEHPTFIQPPVVPVVDTTGAGDAFRAGVVFGLLNELSLHEAAAYGTAAASLNIQVQGAAAEPPLLAQVEELARRLV